jgi:hypothetical protein
LNAALSLTLSTTSGTMRSLASITAVSEMRSVCWGARGVHAWQMISCCASNACGCASVR